MWRSTFVPGKQTDRTCWTIQTHSDELKWARRRTFQELSSLTLVPLMKSSTLGLGLSRVQGCIGFQRFPTWTRKRLSLWAQHYPQQNVLVTCKRTNLRREHIIIEPFLSNEFCAIYYTYFHLTKFAAVLNPSWPKVHSTFGQVTAPCYVGIFSLAEIHIQGGIATEKENTWEWQVKLLFIFSTITRPCLVYTLFSFGKGFVQR